MILNKTRGVNPFLTICARCGGETSELVLVGADDGVYECNACHRTIVGLPKGIECPSCRHRQSWVKKRTLLEGERLPSSQPCDTCKKEIEEHAKIVAEGGVYFRCADCKKQGVIKASAPLTRAVREKMKIPPPKPCGVEFSKANCPECGPNPVKP